MIRILFLLLISSFWIISATEPDYDVSGADSQIDGTANNTNKQIYEYGAAPQNTNYKWYGKTYKLKPGSYGYGAEQVNKTSRTAYKRYYSYGAEPQNTVLNGTTSKPKNDGHHPYDDARTHQELPNMKNEESTVNIKMYIFITVAAGSGILIGTIIGVLCRKKCKNRDSEPIVSFTTADPVYDDVYSAKLAVRRPPHPIPFEEREENKPYIHYDTPYDHRCGWKPLPRAVTFK